MMYNSFILLELRSYPITLYCLLRLPSVLFLELTSLFILVCLIVFDILGFLYSSEKVLFLCLFWSFDKIINKEIPANVVYEDDKVAFYCFHFVKVFYRQLICCILWLSISHSISLWSLLYTVLCFLLAGSCIPGYFSSSTNTHFAYSKS